jgi:hypothetical protein
VRESIALLMFTRNDIEDAIAVIDCVAPAVDEILIVDSSSPDVSALLQERIRTMETECQILRYLPLGMTEPYRPAALARLRSKYALHLDSDEMPSPELIGSLPSLTSADGYWIPRFEKSLDAYSYQLRLYRARCIDFTGSIHEQGTVRGRVDFLPRNLSIVHNTDYADYSRHSKESRRGSYFVAEAFLRPFSESYMRSLIKSRYIRALVRDRDKLLPTWVVRIIIEIVALRRYLNPNRIRANHRVGRLLKEYSIARHRYFLSLSEEEQRLALSICGEVVRAGGLIRYLGLDKLGALERLTATFSWDRPGAEVLKELLFHRHYFGVPLDSFRPGGLVR